MKQTKTMVPEGMRAVKRKSVMPIYAVGILWLVWALILPLHSLLHYLLAGAAGAAVYLLLNKLVPEVVTHEPIPQQQTGDDVADALLKEGQREAVRNQVARLELAVDKILDQVELHPEQAADLRRFMNYYLPTLEKITDTYALLEEQGVEGENITQAKDSICQMLDVMEGAFSKQLDALFRHTALDVTSDIFAMQTLMAQEGMMGQQMPKAEAATAQPAQEAPAETEIKLHF